MERIVIAWKAHQNAIITTEHFATRLATERIRTGYRTITQDPWGVAGEGLEAS